MIGSTKYSTNEHFPCGDVGILSRVQRAVEFLIGLVTDGEVLAIHLQFYWIMLDWCGKLSRSGRRCGYLYSLSVNG